MVRKGSFLYTSNMKNKTQTNSLKKLLIISVVVNAALVTALLSLFFPDKIASNTDVAEFTYLQEKLCGEDYERQLAMRDSEEAKKVYAITVCMKNYKTGEPLDLKPLEDQVE